MVAMFDGNYPEALTWTQRAVDVDAANPTTGMMHAMMLAANGRRDEGVAILDAVARDASPMAWARLAPALACALRGQRDELLRVMTPELRTAASGMRSRLVDGRSLHWRMSVNSQWVHQARRRHGFINTGSLR
jgi:predicted Zn-dependent protease